MEKSRAHKNLNMRVPEDWIRERRAAMALCGCTNLSEWIRAMVEEGERIYLSHGPGSCKERRKEDG